MILEIIISFKQSKNSIMQKHITIAVCLLTIMGCTPNNNNNPQPNPNPNPAPVGSSNGSYIHVSWGSHSVTIIDSTLATGGKWSTVIAAPIYDAASQTSIFGIKGDDIHKMSFNIGSSKTGQDFTGVYVVPVNGGKLTDYSTGALIYYTADSGTLNVTHSDAVYVQGTFAANLVDGTNLIPMTGDFKIYK